MYPNLDSRLRRLSASHSVSVLVCMFLVSLGFLSTFPFRDGISDYFEYGTILVGTAFLSPYFEILVVLFFWIQSRHAHPFVRGNCKKLLNFQCSTAIYSTVFLGLLFFGAKAASTPNYEGGWIVLGFFIFLSPLIIAFKLVTLVASAIKAISGQTFHYPLSLQLLH